jgi:hypothetical protein
MLYLITQLMECSDCRVGKQIYHLQPEAPDHFLVGAEIYYLLKCYCKN